jgi:lysophospholipase L1-like esterase
MSGSESFTEKLQQGIALLFFWGLCLLLLDVGFRGVLHLTDDLGARSASEVEDPRARAAPYRDAPYDAAAFFRELRAARKEAYTPYVVWRTRPFDGEFIDVDEDGNRAAHRAGDGREPLRIWLFGGSVIWGLGAPDSQTVSSHLARRLGEAGVDVEVRNLGEIGFVNTQEIVLLLRELQHGRRPDLVVFFDGVNDAPAAALWPEFDGNHMNFTSIRDRFEKRERQAPHPLLRLLRRSGIWRMADALRAKLDPRTGRVADPPYTLPSDAAETRRRGERAAELWLANRRFVDALGERYGFTAFYLLQPSLKVGAKPAHPSELAILDEEMQNDAKRVAMESFAAMRDAVRRELAGAGAANGRTADLSDLFAGVSEPLYFDYVHVGHSGNRLIAAGIADLLTQQLCGAPEGAIPPRARAQRDRLCR